MTGAAREAGVVEGTVRLAIRSGRLQAVRTACDTVWLVPAAALRRWITDRAA